jgi:hypothetical protein
MSAPQKGYRKGTDGFGLFSKQLNIKWIEKRDQQIMSRLL